MSTNIGLFLIISRAIVTLIVIAFLTPQTFTTDYDYVLRAIYSSGIFLEYPNAKKFVLQFTCFCILYYVLMNVLLYF